MNAVIEDADKIFLRIDSSATQKMKQLMQNRRQEEAKLGIDKKGKLSEKEEKKEISNNVLRIMYPTSNRLL